MWSCLIMKLVIRFKVSYSQLRPPPQETFYNVIVPYHEIGHYVLG
jgi:hypothetical protein